MTAAAITTEHERLAVGQTITTPGANYTVMQRRCRTARRTVSSGSPLKACTTVNVKCFLARSTVPIAGVRPSFNRTLSNFYIFRANFTRTKMQIVSSGGVISARSAANAEKILLAGKLSQNTLEAIIATHICF